MHIFHDWHIDMTHDEVISTCRICGKVKHEPWYPIEGWCRPPQIPPPKMRTTSLRTMNDLPPKKARILII